MKFSVRMARRKWHYRRIACGKLTMVTAIALVLWASPVPAETRSNNPFGNLFQDFGAPRLQGQTVGRYLPKPRPGHPVVPDRVLPRAWPWKPSAAK